MKKTMLTSLLLPALFLLPASPCKAQSTSDLITELILDYKKLTVLQDILDDMYQGYQIVDKGYTAIRDLAQGNFNLHKLFLDGLLVVSPAVRDDWRIADIIQSERSIISEYRAALGRFRASGQFTASELDYIGNMYAALAGNSETAIDELALVTTGDALRMSDAERLQAIDRVHAAITGQLAWLRRFNSMADIQAIQRAREAGDITILKKLYGIQH